MAEYLVPQVDAPYDRALDDLVQPVVAGLTGLPGHLVRPRWQRIAPNTPAIDVDWCGVGVQSLEADYGAYEEPLDADHDTVSRHETLEVVCSFYGPSSATMAYRLRDGLRVQSNLDIMARSGLFLRDTGNILTTAELVNGQWLGRHDITVWLRRQVTSTYAVGSIESAELILYNDVGMPPATVEVTP